MDSPSNSFPDTLARDRVFAFKQAKNIPTFKKVAEAIARVGNEKGASVIAIINWILNNYSILDPANLKTNVKKAILKGLKDGIIARANASRGAMGVSGSFVISDANGSKHPKKTNSRKDVRSSPITTGHAVPIQSSTSKNAIKRKNSASALANDMRTKKKFPKIGSKNITK